MKRAPVTGFLVWTVAVGLALVLLGGEGALAAMYAGCAIGVLASIAGALPAMLARRRGAQAAPLQGMLVSMALRLATVVALGLSAGLSGWFAVRPLLIWVALGYVAQLAVDVRYAVRGF